MHYFHALGCIFKFALRCKKFYRIGPRLGGNEQVSDETFKFLPLTKDRQNWKLSNSSTGVELVILSGFFSASLSLLLSWRLGSFRCLQWHTVWCWYSWWKMPDPTGCPEAELWTSENSDRSGSLREDRLKKIRQIRPAKKNNFSVSI